MVLEERQMSREEVYEEAWETYWKKVGVYDKAWKTLGESYSAFGEVLKDFEGASISLGEAWENLGKAYEIFRQSGSLEE